MKIFFFFRNQGSSIFYTLSILNMPQQTNVVVPTLADYCRFCPSTILNPLTLYNNYWDLNICSKVTDQNLLDSIRNSLLKVWQQKNPQVPDLNVQLFKNLIQYFTSGFV